MNEEDLRRALEDMKNENKALKYRCMDKETYVIGGIEYDWQKAIKLTEDQAKAIEWFIDESDVDYYIQKASEVKDEVK